MLLMQQFSVATDVLIQYGCKSILYLFVLITKSLHLTLALGLWYLPFFMYWDEF